VPNAEFAADLVRWMIPRPIGSAWAREADVPITISSGTTREGGRVWFAHNWSGTAQSISPPAGARPLYGTGGELGPWSVSVWTESPRTGTTEGESR
jgi:beta-galactosidase